MPPIAAGGRLVLLLVAAALFVAACGVSPQPSERTGATPRPIIIDTDLDVSDIAAVAVLLLDPSLDVRALTIAPTGTGVTSCASGRAVARYVLEQLGASSVPYACGRADPGPDGLPFPPEWRTAADTGWGIDMPLQAQSEVPETATDLIARAVAGSPTPPWIVALGPWTNLEDALAADPSVLERVAGIHAMAGSVDAPGNVFVEGFGAEDRLEWNVAADPSAFTAAFNTDVALSIVPLDATEDVPVRQELLDRLADAGDVAGANFIYELMLRVPTRIGEGQQLWDELAALAFADPELVGWEEMSLSSTAEGRLDRAEDGRTVRVAMRADLDAAEGALLASLGRGPTRPTPFALTGDITVSWDGTACATSQTDGLALGVSLVTFENHSGAPAGLTVAGVVAPHTWNELATLVEGLTADDVQVGPPAWITEAVTLIDETDEGGERTGTVAIGLGSTYGPICVTGQWPDLEFTPGDPFTLAP